MKDISQSSKKNSNAVANQVAQKKSKGVSLPSSQPAQLTQLEEEEPMQGKFKSGTETGKASE